METAILILAAGSSSRMGQSKQLLKIDSESLLVRSIRTAMAVSKTVVVVLGANFEAHRQAIGNLAITLVENKKWKNGMGSSLKEGVNYLLTARPNSDAALVMVCDQPLVTSAHLNKLITTSMKSGKPIIASSYRGTAGVPAVFKKSQFGKLRVVEDDSGARKIIAENKNDVDVVRFEGGAVDLDTPADYEAFLQGKARS